MLKKLVNVKTLLASFALLALGTLAASQPMENPCVYVGGTNCTRVSATNPLPVTGSFTPSGTQDVNLTQVNGAAAVTGHGTAAGALRVELPTDGTGVVNLGTIGGAATAANQATMITSLSSIVTNTGVNVISAARTARGTTITAGGTAQTLMAANASRKGFTIQNPCSLTTQGIAVAESLFINFTSAATVNTSANTVELAPCSSYSEGLNGGAVSQELVSVIGATTGHIIYAKEF